MLFIGTPTPTNIALNNTDASFNAPTPPTNISLNNIDASFNGGAQIASWTLPVGKFDVSHFTLEVYTHGRLVSSVRLDSTVTSLPVGVLGPLGTSSQVALYTHTLCGDVIGPGFSNFQSTRLFPSKCNNVLAFYDVIL